MAELDDLHIRHNKRQLDLMMHVSHLPNQELYKQWINHDGDCLRQDLAQQEEILKGLCGSKT